MQHGDLMRLEYFQMVDRITALDVAGRRIVTSCQVPEQSPVFEGHFPGYPILPGVLMIETMAQTGGWLVLAAMRLREDAVPDPGREGQDAVLRRSLARRWRSRPTCCTRVRLRRGQGQHHAPTARK